MTAMSCGGALCTLLLVCHLIIGDGFVGGMAKRTLRLSLQSIDDNTPHPYWTALRIASENIRHRYFFPGHGGIGLMEMGAMEKLDLPELDETDNIHAPEGPLKSSLDSTAKLFRSSRSWFLVNGSTSGILAAILALKRLSIVRFGSSSRRRMLLVPRDSHKSVFDALSVFDLDATLIPTKTDESFQVSTGVDIPVLKSIINASKTKFSGLILTRPTYQGLMLQREPFLDLIAFCHQNDIPVVVDEAHGAHLQFLTPSHPHIACALDCGADIVIQSAHKTLNSLSQTAFMHLNRGAFQWSTSPLSTESAAQVLQESVSSLTTTSPSALLIASLDVTQTFFFQHGPTVVSQIAQLVEDVKRRIRDEASDVILLLDDHLTSYKSHDADPSRLSLQVRPRVGCSFDSVTLDDILCEEFGIYCELNLPRCITYIVPVNAKREALQYLVDAILTVAQRIRNARTFLPSYPSPTTDAHSPLIIPSALVNDVSYCFPSATLQGLQAEIINDALVGKISGETLNIYPPGIPFLIKGEVIRQDHISTLQILQQGSTVTHKNPLLASGQCLTGHSDESLKTLLVRSSKV